MRNSIKVLILFVVVILLYRKYQVEHNFKEEKRVNNGYNPIDSSATKVSKQIFYEYVDTKKTRDDSDKAKMEKLIEQEIMGSDNLNQD